MEFDELLEKLSRNETNKMKKYIYSLLLKYSENVSVLEERSDDYLPLLFIKNDAMGLVYADENFNNFKYIFSNYEEILIILQKHLNEGKILFFYCATVFEETIEELKEKIDIALLNGDVDSFNHYSQLLIDRRK